MIKMAGPLKEHLIQMEFGIDLEVRYTWQLNENMEMPLIIHSAKVQNKEIDLNEDAISQLMEDILFHNNH